MVGRFSKVFGGRQPLECGNYPAVEFPWAGYLHEVLVAARNIALEDPGTGALLDIVDFIEAVPVWIADSKADRTDDVLQVFNALAEQYPACRLAAKTASRLRE